VNPSPAALDIPVKNPGHGALAGSTIVATYEFKVVNYTRTDRNVLVYLPSAKAVLPLTASQSVTIFFLGKTVAISNGKWTSPDLFTQSTTLHSNVTFSSGTSAYLSTSKLAVMATASSGSLTVEFRWHWTVDPAGNQSARVGPWSVPSSTEKAPFLPSIFFPAPYVGVPSTSGSPAPSSTNFTLELNGTVANTSFRVVLEYPNNGTEIQSIWENSSPRSSVFNATVPLTYRDGSPIPAGNYLIHVHDVCEAIVHLNSVTVTASNGTGSSGSMPIAAPIPADPNHLPGALARADVF
jgi:hypothetical protein